MYCNCTNQRSNEVVLLLIVEIVASCLVPMLLAILAISHISLQEYN